MSKIYVHTNTSALIKAMETRLRQEAEIVRDRLTREFREELKRFSNLITVTVLQQVNSDSADLVFVIPEKDLDLEKKETHEA